MARHAHDQRAAFFLADYCHSLNSLSQGFVNLCDSHPVTRVGRAVAQGVVDSAYDHLTYALEHPGETAFDLAVLLVAPELRATVALCRLAALAHHAYQHREEISAVARQFMDDIQNNAHHDPEWLAQNGYIFTHVLSDVFVVPQIGNKLMNTGSMRPLANGLRRQTEAVQACIRSGVNAAGQKACDGLKNILQNAGEALKTGNPQPAFAGVQNNASLRTVNDQANRAAHGLMKAAGDAAKNSQTMINPGVLVGEVTELRKVKFFRGLQHGLTNHFFGQDKSSLKILDPGGNPEKWTTHIIKLAQNGNGPIRDVPTGKIMEIMGAMTKSDGTGILNVGVRIFKKHDSDLWKLTTVLTEQNHPLK